MTEHRFAYPPVYSCSLPLLPVVLTASQSNSSLKKQRSRGIFSTFFCCFRNYNVEPPASNTNTSSQPPPVEENGSPPKVGCCSTELKPFFFFFTIFVDPLLSLYFVILPTPHPVFVCVYLYLLCCSVTRSRSSLSLVYVLPFFSFPLHAGWVGWCWHILSVWAPVLLRELLLCYRTAVHFQPIVALAVCKVYMHLWV